MKSTKTSFPLTAFSPTREMHSHSAFFPRSPDRDSATSREKSSRSESIPKSSVEDSDVVTRFQEATQSMMGRISGMGRITGGLANKLGGGILKF